MNGGKFQDIRSLLPGMRTVKTGLAVAISLFVNQLLGLELSFYAVIAVVISMDKSIQLSFNAGKSRLIGTVLGALLGLAAAELPAAPLPPPEGAIIFNHHLSYYLRLFAVFERRCRQLSIPPAAPGA